MTQKAVVNSPKKRRKISGYEIPLHLMLIPGIIIIFICHYVSPFYNLDNITFCILYTISLFAFMITS